MNFLPQPRHMDTCRNQLNSNNLYLFANSVFFPSVPLWSHTFQQATGQSLLKVVPQDRQCASSLNRGQHHSKETPALWRGEDNQTHLVWPQRRWDGGRHLVWLQAPPTSERFSGGQHREIALKFGATASLRNTCSDSTQAQGVPRLAH